MIELYAAQYCSSTIYFTRLGLIQYDIIQVNSTLHIPVLNVKLLVWFTRFIEELLYIELHHHSFILSAQMATGVALIRQDNI